MHTRISTLEHHARTQVRRKDDFVSTTIRLYPSSGHSYTRRFRPRRRGLLWNQNRVSYLQTPLQKLSFRYVSMLSSHVILRKENNFRVKFLWFVLTEVQIFSFQLRHVTNLHVLIFPSLSCYISRGLYVLKIRRNVVEEPEKLYVRIFLSFTSSSSLTE